MIQRENPTTDPVIWVLAAATFVGAFVITGNRDESVLAGVAVVIVAVLAAAILEVGPPAPTLPHLTERQSRVAMLIWQGCSNPEIAFRLGMTIPGVERRIEAIKNRWRLSTRDQISEEVARYQGGPKPDDEPHVYGLAECLALVGIAIAIAFGGIAILALPPTYLGSAHDPVGLSVMSAGFLLGIAAVVVWWIGARRH